MNAKHIEKLFQNLEKQESSEIMFNQYGYSESVPLHNLKIYLNTVSCFKMKNLFIDICPGYKNGMTTGIPLTNEFILFNRQNGCPLFDPNFGYRRNKKYVVIPDNCSTIFRMDMNYIDMTPLLWYCYPFHPHLKNDILTNREPSESEMQIGMRYLIDILKIFNPERIFALGNTVSGHLNELSIKHIKLVHPFTLAIEICCGKWYSLN